MILYRLDNLLIFDIELLKTVITANKEILVATLGLGYIGGASILFVKGEKR